MGRLLQFDRLPRPSDDGQGGATTSALPPSPSATGSAEANRLRALSWLSYTVALLVEQRGALAGRTVPILALDAVIDEGNAILEALAALHLAGADDATGASAIRALQDRIEAWRGRILG